MTYLDAIFLGSLQGATEFLPVSSSGHLALAQHLLGDFQQPGVLFDVLLHLGTMVAVIIYFRRDLWQLISSLWRRDEMARQQRFMVGLLIAGSLPTAAIGLLFKDFFISLFDRPVIVCGMLLVTGSLLWLAERRRPGPNQDVAGRCHCRRHRPGMCHHPRHLSLRLNHRHTSAAWRRR